MTTKKTLPKISIIIVNWNGIHFLKLLLRSIAKQSYKNYETILVDNGSTDKSVFFTKKYYPNVKIIKLRKNNGFAKPNNIGFKHASGKYIVTLNNDLVLDKDFLRNLNIFVKSTDNSVYALSTKIVNYYNRSVIDTVGIKPLANGNGINIGKNESVKKYNSCFQVFGPCAGAALYKSSVIKKIGFFDKSYFAYLEDLDLAYRANRLGYTALFCPSAVCYHKHSQTSKKFPFFKLFLIERNRLLNLVKYYPRYNLLTENIFTFHFLLKHFLIRKNRKKISIDQRNYFRLQNIFKLVGVYAKARIYVLKYLWNNI